MIKVQYISQIKSIDPKKYGSVGNIPYAVLLTD